MIDDCTNRLKVRRGSDIPWSKLTEDDVRICRELHAYKMAEVARLESSLSINALAEKFGVHPRTMEKVLNFDTWKHVR